jgi:hypothetical protein
MKPHVLLLATAFAALVSTLGATTLLDDNLARLSHWKLQPAEGPAGRLTSSPAGGATLAFPSNGPDQVQALSYVGPGLRRGEVDAYQKFNWSSATGPITYSFSILEFPGLQTETYKLGYEVILVLACDDTEAFTQPHIQPANALVFRVVDAGVRSELGNKALICAQVFFKTNQPDRVVVYHKSNAELARLTTREDKTLDSMIGTWSITINHGAIHITAPNGTRSPVGNIAPDKVAAFAARSATLHLVVGSNTRTGGEAIRIGHVSVLPGVR